MVIFFCTFLALRSQDSGRPVDDIKDYELDEEEEIFGGQVNPFKRLLSQFVCVYWLWACSQIIDDGYLHALRIYRDTVSGAVRLQASIHKGEMKRCVLACYVMTCALLIVLCLVSLRAPVWTAFITHHISSSAWLRRPEPKTIYVRELRRAIFSSEYAPPKTQRGEHILQFTSRSGRLAPKSLITNMLELCICYLTDRLTA